MAFIDTFTDTFFIITDSMNNTKMPIHASEIESYLMRKDGYKYEEFSIERD